MDVRDRIIEFRSVILSDLTGHRDNWKYHPRHIHGIALRTSRVSSYSEQTEHSMR